MKIIVEFNNNTGSFALDALATTFQGSWDSRSSTRTSGIITEVDADSKEWFKEVLESDDNVTEYTFWED